MASIDGPALRTTERDEKPISWLEAGQGEPVIFLHAMAGSRTAWKPQINSLSSRYHCIAWDMPGFGGSAAAPPDMGIHDVTDALANFMSGPLGLASAHLVGLSVGGMILQHFAVSYPEMCRSLVILASSPKFGFGGDIRPAEFTDPILMKLRSGCSIEAFSDGMINAIVGPECDAVVRHDAIAAMSRAHRSGLELTTRLIGAHDALDQLGWISCPTLVMAGEKDAETPPAYADELARRIPGASKTIVPGAGHIVNLEQPELVTRRIAFFLESAL